MRLRHEQIAGRPLYGVSVYLTECGRFSVRRIGCGTWGVCEAPVHPAWLAWHDWLVETGLYGVTFRLRRELLEALATALHVDGLARSSSLETTV